MSPRIDGLLVPHEATGLLLFWLAAFVAFTLTGLAMIRVGGNIRTSALLIYGLVLLVAGGLCGAVLLVITLGTFWVAPTAGA